MTIKSEIIENVDPNLPALKPHRLHVLGQSWYMTGALVSHSPFNIRVLHSASGFTLPQLPENHHFVKTEWISTRKNDSKAWYGNNVSIAYLLSRNFRFRFILHQEHGHCGLVSAWARQFFLNKKILETSALLPNFLAKRKNQFARVRLEPWVKRSAATPNCFDKDHPYGRYWTFD